MAQTLFPRSGRTGTTGTGVNWRAVVAAGLIGGFLLLVVQMALVGLSTGGSAWGPPRGVAAMVLGEGALTPPDQPDLRLAAVALLVQAALSIVYAAILGWALERGAATPRLATVAGGVFGLIIYLVNFHGFAPILFPWLVGQRSGITLFSHVLFGLVLGWTYIAVAGEPRLRR